VLWVITDLITAREIPRGWSHSGWLQPLCLLRNWRCAWPRRWRHAEGLQARSISRAAPRSEQWNARSRGSVRTSEYV